MFPRVELCYDSVGLQRITAPKSTSPLLHTFKLCVWGLSKVIEAVYERSITASVEEAGFA